MLKGIRFIAGVLFLLFVGVVFLCSVRTSPSYILLLSIFAAVVGAAIALMDDRAGFFSLGVALCTLPFFGSGTLNLFVLGWVSGVYLLRSMFGVPYASIDLSGSKEIASWALFLFVLPLASSLGLTLFADFDSALLSSLFRNLGVIGVFRFLSGAEVTWFRALTTACGSIVGIMLFFAILSSANVRQNFQDLLAGLCVGGAVAVCFLLGQLLEVHSFFFMNLNPFWHYVGRYPATFSDPNAFGVMTMLIVPALIGCAIGSRGPIYAFVAVLLLCFSIWSGSRTMYLGLVVWGIMYLHFLVKRTNRKELLYALWIGAAFFTVFVFLLGYPSVNEKLQSSLPFPSTVRVLKTIHWSEAEGMLFSRRTYSKIAYHTWQKSPMTGIGLERFFSEQRRIMKSLNIDLGQWRDNANNYYLQVLAEEGVLGLALLLFSIALFGFALLSTERKVLLESTQVEPAFVERGFFVTRSLMFVIALVLMTGPHVNFPEVRYLVMVMLAVSASRPIVIRTSFLNVIRVVSLMLALLFPPLFALSVSRGVEKTHSTGFYSAEEVSGRMAAWTSDRARLHLCDVYSDRVRLRLRAGNPDIASRPLRIALFERDPRDTGALDLTNLHPVRVKLTTGEWTEVEVPITSDFRAYRKVIELRAERVWNPREAKMGDDPRVLGVMVELPESMC